MELNKICCTNASKILLLIVVVVVRDLKIEVGTQCQHHTDSNHGYCNCKRHANPTPHIDSKLELNLSSTLYIGLWGQIIYDLFSYSDTDIVVILPSHKIKVVKKGSIISRI